MGQENITKQKGITMATMIEHTYFISKDHNGNDYLCPLNSVKDRNAVTDDEFDDCVEKDIVERYSGNIDIKCTQ